ncbi:MAG: ATP synthase F1 subunit epsilon [Gemmataceae bacterium]
MATHAKIRCVVVTPEKALLDDLVDFVAIPMYDGELGVLPGRTPLIGKLGFGELRTTKDDDISRYYVDGGFVQVRDNIVTLLTSKAVAAKDLSVEAAEQAFRTTGAAPTPEEQEARLQAQEKARAQLRIIDHLRQEE